MPPNVRFCAGFIIVFGIPILGYIYSPFEEIPNYAPAVRFVFLPVLVVVGILDVERLCPSTTYFKKIGLTRASRPCTRNPETSGETHRMVSRDQGDQEGPARVSTVFPIA